MTTDHPSTSTGLVPPSCYVSDEVLELAKKTSSATISGQLTRRGYRYIYMTGVRPIRAGTVMAGRAYTLRYLPRREDHQVTQAERPGYAQHIAIESVGKGDALVVDARGNTEAGIFGDLLVARIHYRGAAGLVTDGAMRDVPYLQTLDFPCFIRGAHGYGHPSEHWAADVQLPIACGGVLVRPGDLVMGDDDGVVVCPQAIAEEVVREAVDTEAHELFARELIEGGFSANDIHPLSPEKLADFEVWRKKRGL